MMKTSKRETRRCIQLTDTGLKRLEETRRRYRKSLENIAWDKNTPSINTVKRTFRQGPVFVDTVERIWDYLRTCADARHESLPDLVPGEDYVFESVLPIPTTELPSEDSRRGWLSRQVPRPNRLFLGRHTILGQLHSALKIGPAALIPDAQALTGLGGIGKTQTAIAYVYAHRRDYDGVFWLSAETADNLNDGLAGLAREMKLLDSAAASRQQALDAIHDWFQTHSGWLLVLDNADDLSALAPHFPRHHTGSLLLTTRGRNTTLWAAPLEIPKFERDEGALLILRRAGLLSLNHGLMDIAATVRQEAENLSDVLDGLPLALDQAGAFLAETQISVAEYLQRYQAFGLDLLDQFPDPHHQPVRITFLLAVKQVTRRGKYGEAAVEMLRLCAFLAPDSIPNAIFAVYPFPQDQASGSVKDADYAAEISAVVSGYSLVRRDPAAGTVSLHRLVQRVIRESLSADERRFWIEQTVAVVADASPNFEFEDWFLCDQFLPHWRLCADYIKEYRLESAGTAYLLHQAGRFVRARALYTEATAYLKLSLDIAEKVHGKNHPITAEYLNALACLYRDLDRCDEAEALHKRAVAITEEVRGPDHQETAEALHNLALLYTQQKAFEQAESCFLRALPIFERRLSPDHPTVATALTQLAGVYRGQERWTEAEACYRRALAIYEKTLDPNHVDLAVGCNNLALFYVSVNRPAEAEPLYLRALRINEAVRGAYHPETGTVLWGLAIVQWRQNRLDDAEQSFQRAISIYRKNYREDHSLLLRLLRYHADFQESRSAGNKREPPFLETVGTGTGE